MTTEARQAVHFDHRVQFLAEAERSVRPGSKRVRDPSYFLATCTVLRASVVKILSLHSPKTAPCGRSGLLVAPNGVAPLGDALNALGCGAEPKGDVVAGAPNADGEVAGAPNGDAGAAPKAPTGFPNAFEVPPKPPTPPPPNPPAKAISSQQTSASQLFGSCEGKRRCITRHERVIKRPRHLSRI